MTSKIVSSSCSVKQRMGFKGPLAKFIWQGSPDFERILEFLEGQL